MEQLKLTKIMNEKMILILALTAVLAGLTNSEVIAITDENWEIVTEGEWMLKFYAPWCPACQAIAPVWSDFSSEAAKLKIKVGQVDVSESPGLSGRFLVTSLPTMYHVVNGQFRVYTGSRGKDEFVSFIADKRYTELPPVSSWKAPNSFAMSIVSLVFKLSMAVRHFHLIMTVDYGFPAWSVYGFFAVCTVVMGLALGMVLVFITDWVCPSRPPTRPLEAEPAIPSSPSSSSSSENVTLSKDDDKEEEEEEDEDEEEEDTSTPPTENTTTEGQVDNPTTVRKRKTEAAETSEDKD